MSRAKSHHYVPRFYLAAWGDADSRLSVYDKKENNAFITNVKNVASGTNFYTLDHLVHYGGDGLELERQFADLEGEAAQLFRECIGALEQGLRIALEPEARRIMSMFIGLQSLRTVQARNLAIQTLQKIHELAPDDLPDVSSSDPNKIHSELLWNERLITQVTDAYASRIWMFGRNDSETLFLTSDHPALIKDEHHRGFVVDKAVLNFILGEPLYNSGDYFVYPLSPRWILYAFDRVHYPTLERIDCAISPVEFTKTMVEHENAGQIGASHRFVFSADGDFTYTRQFCRDQPWVVKNDRDLFEFHDDPYSSQREGQSVFQDIDDDL